MPEGRRQSLLDEVFPLIHRGGVRLAIAVAWVFVEVVAANMRAEQELRRQAPGVIGQNAGQAIVGQQQVNLGRAGE